MRAITHYLLTWPDGSKTFVHVGDFLRETDDLPWAACHALTAEEFEKEWDKAQRLKAAAP